MGTNTPYITGSRTGNVGIAQIVFLLLLVFSSVAFADTHYVRKSGTDSGTCTVGSPCLTITYGISKMGRGDILVIGDGTYAEGIKNPPSGSVGAYTVVKAENIHGVVIDISSAGNWVSGIDVIAGRSYITIEGFIVKGNLTNENNNAPVYIGGDHIKLFRVAAFNAAQTGNSSVMVAGAGSSYVLFEECWAWGTGRYKIQAYQSSNVIFRRCVARHDYHGGNSSWSHQEALFVNYDATNTQIQNCIGIDSGVDGDTTQQIYGGIWDENNANSDKSSKYTGNIFLNLRNNYGGMMDKPAGTKIYNNNIIWDSGGGYGTNYWVPYDNIVYPPTVTMSNMTIGKIVYPAGDVYSLNGVGVGDPWNNHVTVTNSIFDNILVRAIGDYVTSDYNVLYGNGVNYRGVNVTPSAGANDDNTTNPLTSGLLYLPRIENGSARKTKGSSGGQVGAQIMYRYGVSGTLYGEDGYDTLTSTPLWPFPNEALIKADFASYSGLGPSGARGFATGTSMDGSKQSLTKYIWEYIGNQIPPDIYGRTITPLPPSRLSIQ